MTLEEKQNLAPLLRKVILFRYLTEDALADMLTTCEIARHGEGERIVHEGEVDDRLYAVLEGSVNVMVHERDNPAKEVFICALGEGDVFGEAGLFLQTARTAGVVTGCDSTVMSIGREKFLQLIQKHPPAGIKILYVIIYSLLKKLREANQELAFERKAVLRQGDIDSIVEEAMRKM